MRPMARVLALIGCPARRCMGERGVEGVIFAVMEAGRMVQPFAMAGAAQLRATCYHRSC
jgi:hypothetical protein